MWNWGQETTEYMDCNTYMCIPQTSSKLPLYLNTDFIFIPAHLVTSAIYFCSKNTVTTLDKITYTFIIMHKSFSLIMSVVFGTGLPALLESKIS